MRLFYSVILIAFFSFHSFNYPYEINQKSQFQNYLNFFTSKALPLKINRKTVFGLSKTIYDSVSHAYKENKYPKLKNNFNCFIPKEIKGSDPIENIRCLFILPSLNDITLVVIAKDFIQDNDQKILKIFLITYDSNGVALDYMALAGYYIDLEEEFCLIEKDFHITTKQYKLKESPDKNHPELFYLNETLINLEIDVKGTLTKNFEQKRDGYFEGDWSDYKYIK